MPTENNDETINKLVNLVIDKKFSTEMLYEGEALIQKREEEITEPNKELNGICTDFIVNEFLKTSDQVKTFIKLIYQTFEKGITVYIKTKHMQDNSIFFVYKGGNILRFVATESIKEIPKIVSDPMIDFYKDSFKKSDADFSIYIDPHLKEFDEVLCDMTQLAYLLQNYIRNQFVKDMIKYFEFYKLNIKEKEKLISDLLKKLNETDTIKNHSFDFNGKFTSINLDNIKSGIGNLEEFIYIPRSDFEMQYTDEKKACTSLINLKTINMLDEQKYSQLKFLIDHQKELYKNKQRTELYISSNRTLTFRKAANQLASFNLVRTKVSFNVNFEYAKKDNVYNFVQLLKLNGELIDVSIPKKDDSTIFHFFEHLDKYLAEFKIGTDEDIFKFKAYSLEYLTEDLERMLFDDVEYPWLDAKYMKRIKRLLYMYFIILLTNPKLDNKKRISYLNCIKDAIFGKLQNIIKLQNFNKNAQDELLITIKDFLQSDISRLIPNSGSCEAVSFVLNDRNAKIHPIRKLIINLGYIILKGVKENLVELENYVKIILENLTLMIKALKDYENLIRQDGTISEVSLYEAANL